MRTIGSLCLWVLVATAAWAENEEGRERAIPYYFVAVHNEPFHGMPAAERMVAEHYEILREMVARADEQNVKLTLMFSVPWAEHIAGDAGRLEEVMEWSKRGHEIAAHHHSIYHGNWDGYTDYAPEEAASERGRRARATEPYEGTLDDFIACLRKINPRIQCGCLNDEADKRALPDAIVHDTCSGFANFGEPGRRLHDADPDKARNDYITVADWNGIARKWLTHYQITRPDRLKAGERVFRDMSAGVFGAVLHSSRREAECLEEFLDFLRGEDPEGERSRTVSEIIENKLIPEKRIESELLQEKPRVEAGMAGPQPPPQRRPPDEIREAVARFQRLLRERRQDAGETSVKEALRLDRASREAFRAGDWGKCIELLEEAAGVLENAGK